MKKTWKRLVSLLLTAILLAAVLCLPTALAAEKAPNDYGIKEYVALGDSIAQGKNETTDGSGIFKTFFQQGVFIGPLHSVYSGIQCGNLCLALLEFSVRVS